MDVSVVHCFVITGAVGGANVQHRRYTYECGRDQKCITAELFSNLTLAKGSSKADHAVRRP
jgi:hypothetical protein